MKRIAVTEKFYECFRNYFSDAEVLPIDDDGEVDLVIGNKSRPDADICIHPSLLPAFDTENPIKDAFMAGVKVSGVTIYSPKNNQIIAQYPVLIGNGTHFDEFEDEINKLEQLLCPIVVDKILKDEVFDFSDLLGGCQNGNCKNCSNCH